jgi:DNA-binding phage protein
MTPAERASEWILHAMREAGVNQSQLSRQSGIARAAVCRALKGRRNLRVSSIFGLIEACGFEIVELRVRRKNGIG